MTDRLSESAMKKLQEIADRRGVDAFRKRAGIRPETFRSILTKGHAKPEVVKKVIEALQPVVQPDLIETIVSTEYGMTLQKLLTGRDYTSTEARQIVMLFLRSMTSLTRPEIVKRYGYETEASVNNGITAIEDKISVNTDLSNKVDRIRLKIQAAA